MNLNEFSDIAEDIYQDVYGTAISDEEIKSLWRAYCNGTIPVGNSRLKRVLDKIVKEYG